MRITYEKGEGPELFIKLPPKSSIKSSILSLQTGQISSSLIFSVPKYTSKEFSPENKRDLRMACHTSSLKKAKKQGEMPLSILSPIHLNLCVDG